MLGLLASFGGGKGAGGAAGLAAAAGCAVGCCRAGTLPRGMMSSGT